MDITRLVKDAVRYNVRRAADAAKHGDKPERGLAFTAEDALRQAGYFTRRTDTDWEIVRMPTMDERRAGAKWYEGETVARFPRKMSTRKTCLTYYDIMPDMPRRIEV